MTNYIVQYFKDEDGYTAQVVNWPDVVACGASFDECRTMLISAIQEMAADYRADGKAIPGETKDVIFENLPVELAGVV